MSIRNLQTPTVDEAQTTRDPQTPRTEAYRKLCSDYGIDLDGRSCHSGEEDAMDYLADPQTIKRYCAVTEHGIWRYAYPDYETPEGARERASEFIDDGLFSEQPVAVVDLDNDQAWEPALAVTWQARP
jgi:hypothetical protein